MRTMKNVMLDKLTHKYLQKKTLTVESAKELTYDEMVELNIPKIVRDNISTMDKTQTIESTIREAQKIVQAATAIDIEVPTYDPLVEEKVAIEVATDYVVEAVELVVEPVAEPVVEEKVETVVELVEPVAAPVYTEEELRRVFESTELTGGYTAMLKKVKPMLDAKQYDAELLITLAKEYAAKQKK